MPIYSSEAILTARQITILKNLIPKSHAEKSTVFKMTEYLHYQKYSNILFNDIVQQNITMEKAFIVHV